MTVLMTGFPGFLGSALLPRILRRTGAEAICLVQPKFAALARRRVEELEAAEPALRGHVTLVEGDITSPGLGLPPAGLDRVTAETTELWHLAAVYDLAVSRELGMRVNVEGTRHVLDVAERCGGLRRLQYFSTCYVSGRYAGPFAEDDLEVGAPFNNFYEETKHLAEVDVRARMARGLPATIYRPSIVVGDSASGETQKYDGPYFLFQWLMRQRGLAVVPVLADPAMIRFNVVPRDYVIVAVERLAGLPESEGRTYQLADPRPPTVAELVAMAGAELGRRVATVRVPRRAARRASGLRAVERWVRMPAEALDYFAHPAHYLTGNVRAALAGSGIEAPALRDYLPRLLAFMRAHPEVGVEAMV